LITKDFDQSPSVNDLPMKRRDFLNLTVGAAILSPVVTKAAGEDFIPFDPPPAMVPTLLVREENGL
jgi:hypothetical protein